MNYSFINIIQFQVKSDGSLNYRPFDANNNNNNDGHNINKNCKSYGKNSAPNCDYENLLR